MNVLIKKSQIAVNASDARPSFVGGERIDRAVAELNLEKEKNTNFLKKFKKKKL